MATKTAVELLFAGESKAFQPTVCTGHEQEGSGHGHQLRPHQYPNSSVYDNQMNQPPSSRPQTTN